MVFFDFTDLNEMLDVVAEEIGMPQFETESESAENAGLLLKLSSNDFQIVFLERTENPFVYSVDFFFVSHLVSPFVGRLFGVVYFYYTTFTVICHQYRTNMEHLFTLNLEPKAKGRPRVSFRGGYARAYTPAATARWEKAAAILLQAQWRREALAEPVAVHIDAIVKRPGRLHRKKDPDGLLISPTFPDADNVAKAVLDAMQKAGVLKDDKFVVDLRVRNLYSTKHANGSVIIKLYTIKEGTIEPIACTEGGSGFRRTINRPVCGARGDDTESRFYC